MAHYEASVEFKCPACGEVVSESVDVPETNWSGDNADERFVEDDAEAGCNNCNTGFVLHIQNSDGRIAAQILDHEEVEVECGDAEMVGSIHDDIDWAYDDVPDEPAEILFATLFDVSNLLDQVGFPLLNWTLHRMAFIQQFAALEAYLSDRLIGAVTGDPAALEKSLTAISELKERKFTLAAFHADADIVKKTIAAYLRELMYHNFTKIDAIYKATLGFGIFPDTDVSERMFKALPIRHDCVHRNGKDKDGRTSFEVNTNFVKQTDRDIRAMIIHIEGKFGKDVASKQVPLF